MARVLVVEEDLALGHMLGLFAEEEGYDLVVVPSLAEALKRLAEQNFDLILRDSLVATPGQFFEAPDPLLDLPEHPPILVVTGHLFDLELLRARGYAGLIAKPFDLGAFADALRSYLGS